MTTATAMEPINDPNVADADEFERAGLEAPEGIYHFILAGAYGLGETNNGKKYLNVMYLLDEVARYDEDGNITETETLKVPYRVFHKFWIESGYGNNQLNSWFTATTGTPKGEFDPALGRYVFKKDEQLAKTVGEGAWNRIRHSKDDTYGWQIDVGRDFRKKPQNRIKVDG